MHNGFLLLKKAKINTTQAEEIFAADKNRKKKFDADKKAIDEKLKLEVKGTKAYEKLERESVEKTKEFNRARRDDYLKVAKAAGDALTGLFKSITDREKAEITELTSIKDKIKTDADKEKTSKEAESESEIAALEEQYKAGLITEDKYKEDKLDITKKLATAKGDIDTKVKDDQEKLQREIDKKKAEQAKKEAIRNKAMAAFNATLGVATVILSAMKTDPFVPMGLIMASIAGAMGLAQLHNIANTPIPKAAKGKLIGGKSHEQGGELIEAEAGEMIINKRSSSVFAPLLSAVNQAGGGVPFTQTNSDGGFAMREYQRLQGAGSINPIQLKDAIMEGMKESNIYVAVEDINKMEDKLKDVRVTDGRDYKY